jgi:hypothetical protein
MARQRHQTTGRTLQPLKYFEGMRMMNGMMKMNGDLDDMGMNMSLQQMDMNVVMYPEITGNAKKVGAPARSRPTGSTRATPTGTTAMRFSPTSSR